MYTHTLTALTTQESQLVEMQYIILDDQAQFGGLCLTPRTVITGGAPRTGDTIFAYTVLQTPSHTGTHETQTPF